MEDCEILENPHFILGVLLKFREKQLSRYACKYIYIHTYEVHHFVLPLHFTHLPTDLAVNTQVQMCLKRGEVEQRICKVVRIKPSNDACILHSVLPTTIVQGSRILGHWRPVK